MEQPMRTRLALVVLWTTGVCPLAACGKDGESNGSSQSAQQVDDGGLDARPCIIPDAAVTYDAGDGGLVSGCQPNLGGCEDDQEYGMVCHGGSGVDLQEPDPSLRCRGVGAAPGRNLTYCCACE
jgi:hypothetical protein